MSMLDTCVEQSRQTGSKHLQIIKNCDRDFPKEMQIRDQQLHLGLRTRVQEVFVLFNIKCLFVKISLRNI